MGKGKVRHEYNPRAMHAILAAPGGGLEKNMFLRATKIQAQARKNLQRAPTRVKTGHLRASILIVPYKAKGYTAFRVGSDLNYARYVHDGTGIYGPKHHLITPKSAHVLAWHGNEGEFVFAKHVKGMRPNPFLRDALAAGKL